MKILCKKQAQEIHIYIQNFSVVVGLEVDVKDHVHCTDYENYYCRGLRDRNS